MIDVSYVPGGRTAIVIDQCWLLIDAQPDSATVHEIWQLMEQVPRLETLIASLFRLGFEHAPDFALLAAGQGRRHLICRGNICATLMTDGTPTRIDGAGLATWLEHPVAAAVERVILGDPPSVADLQLPASAGAFLATSITIALAAVPADRQPRDVPPDPVGPRVVHTAALSAAPADATSNMPADVNRAGSDTAVVEDTGYDFLFAATRARTVEDAAVRPAADADLPPLLSVTVTPESPLIPEPPPMPEAPSRPEMRSSPRPAAAADTKAGDSFAPTGLIDGVPWACEPDRAPQSAHTARGQRGQITQSQIEASGPDHAPTTKRADLQKPAPRAASQDRIGPAVHALLCPKSHPNPPSNSSCRLCGAVLPRQDPALVPRPVLGILRLSTGDVITLDRGVVMGRSPTTDFVGDERPHVVKLPSGDGEISRTHLLVSLDGWHVLVTDLRSTNGTLVGLPGREPERLRPNEPLPIQPGTLVTLADGVDFRFEVAE